MYTCHSTCIKIRGQLEEIILSLQDVDPGDQTQVFRFGIKCLWPLSHLTGPTVTDGAVLFVYFLEKDAPLHKALTFSFKYIYSCISKD